MNSFTTKQMSDLLYDELTKLGEEVVLSNPDTESIFPCRVIGLILETINKTENATTILKTFQVPVEHWTAKKRNCMDMVVDTDIKMQKYNFIKTNTTPDIYDEITKKYRIITTYEVRYNALTNSFKSIK